MAVPQLPLTASGIFLSRSPTLNGYAFPRRFCSSPYKYALFYNPLTRTIQRTNVKAPRRYDDPRRGVPVHDYDPDLGAWAEAFGYDRSAPSEPPGPPGQHAEGLDGSPATDAEDTLEGEAAAPPRWRTVVAEAFAYIPSGGAAFTAPLVPGVPDGLLCVDAFTRYGVKKTASVWYRTADGLKTWKDTGKLPRYHDCHEVCFFFDPRRRRVLYYGGGNAKPRKGREPTQPRLFALDTDEEAPKWTDLEARADGADRLPIPSREVVYVPKHDVFLLVEGLGGTGSLKGPPAIWSLDPGENVFRRLDLSLSDAAKDHLMHAGVSSGLAHDPVTDLCFYIAAGPKPPPLWAFRYVPAK